MSQCGFNQAMNNSTEEELPTDLQYRKGDTIQIIQLWAYQEYNDKLATINGPYSMLKEKWPIEIDLEYGKLQTWIEHDNIKLYNYGDAWTIDPSSPLQRLNLLLKAYIRDLEAFAKLTRREDGIFNDNFVYQIHDSENCKYR